MLNWVKRFLISVSEQKKIQFCFRNIEKKGCVHHRIPKCEDKSPNELLYYLLILFFSFQIQVWNIHLKISEILVRNYRNKLWLHKNLSQQWNPNSQTYN